MIKTEIITIGDELLIGQVVDTNSAWIGEQLNLIGIKVFQITSISDDRQHILKTLREAENRAEIVLITGGLGPTKDDITKVTLCEYFDTHLVFNEKAYNRIENLFNIRGFTMTELNRKQAELPATCLPIPNINGTASGMWFEKNGKIFISMPGVPFEMKQMMTTWILPRLAEKFNSHFIVHKTILTQGGGESFIAKIIENWEDNLPGTIKLAYLPQPGMVRLRLTATGNDKNELLLQLETETEKVEKLIPDLIFGFDNESLEGVIGKHLLSQQATVSTAESCTGGYIAHLITSIPGSSEYFKGSVIAYANVVKKEVLGVKNESLEQYGAVSEEVVIQMAEGVKTKLKTDFAIATSGVAGPDGGSENKPVGYTWIAVATPTVTIARQFLFGEDRGRNIRKTAIMALDMLRKELVKAG